MNLIAVVEQLAAQGVKLRLRGDQIAYEAPKGVLTSEVKATLRCHKEELVSLLRGTVGSSLRETLAAVVERAPPSVTIDEVRSMPLDQFAQAGLKIVVQSEFLNEVVLFVSDNAIVDPGERRIVYRAAELLELVQIGPGTEELQAIHEAKSYFGGRVTSN